MTENNPVRSRDFLKVQALTQRIATLVAQYEEQMAEYRADATLEIENLSAHIQNLQEQLESAGKNDKQATDEDPNLA